MTPRLNINLGIRNDSTIFGHFGSDQYKNNRVGNLDLIRGLYELQINTPSCGEAGGAPCIPGGALPDGVILSPNAKPSRDRPWNFGPRLGIAYRITGKLAVRTCYGVTLDSWAGNVQANMGVVGAWPSVGLLQQPNLDLPTSEQPTPKLTAQDPIDLGDNPIFPTPTPFGHVTWFYDPNVEMPYAQQYFSVQYELDESTLGDLAYAGSRGASIIGADLWVDNGGLSGYDLGGMLCERAARAEPLNEDRDLLVPFLPVNWEELARTMGALRKLRKEKPPGQPAAVSRLRRSPVRLRKGVVSTHSPSIPRVQLVREPEWANSWESGSLCCCLLGVSASLLEIWRGQPPHKRVLRDVISQS